MEHKEPSYWPDPSNEIDSLSDFLQEQFDLDPVISEKISEWHLKEIFKNDQKQNSDRLLNLIAGLLAPGNHRLKVLGLAFAAGLNRVIGFRSMRQAAKTEYGFTVAALQRSADDWIEALNLPIGPHSRSQSIRKTYSTVQKENHWRKKWTSQSSKI